MKHHQYLLFGLLAVTALPAQTGPIGIDPQGYRTSACAPGLRGSLDCQAGWGSINPAQVVTIGGGSSAFYGDGTPLQGAAMATASGLRAAASSSSPWYLWGERGLGVNMAIRSTAQVNDVIAVYVHDLPDGALIPVQLTYTFEGGFSSTTGFPTNGGFDAFGGADLTVSFVYYSGGISACFGYNWCGWGDHESPHEFNQSVSAIINMQNNYRYGFQQTLSAMAGASGRNSARTDFSHTGYSYLTPLVNGATILSASGYKYAAPSLPAPEPGSLALLGVGLAGFGMMRRQRKAS